jgi:hypothetical protein
MRLPRVRLTVRGMMLAVAIVALVVWGERMRRASSAYWERAEFYRYLLTTPRNNPPPSEGESVASTTEIAQGRRLIRYCEIMQAKYERAARRPWLPVEPDPPDPE